MGITAIQAGTVDADFDAVTATSYGGVVEANLPDLSANETVAGNWDFTGDLSVDGDTVLREPVGYKTSNTSRSNDATPGFDTDFRVAIEANVWYAYELVIAITSTSSTPDFQASWTFPAGSLIGTFQQHAVATGGSEDVQTDNWSATPIIAIVGNEVVMVVIKGFFQNSTAGNLDFNWSQNTSNATATTVNAGSYVRLTRLGT